MWKDLYRAVARTWSALERSVVNGQSIKAPFPSRRQWENHLLFQLFSSKISNPVEDEIFSDEMNETDWIAWYGLHGLEILHLSKQDDGTTWHLKKLFGDCNVPDNEISLKASSEDLNKQLIGHPVHIQCADSNFQNPRWEDGSLYITNDHFFEFEIGNNRTQFYRTVSDDFNLRKFLANRIRSETEMTTEKLQILFKVLKYLNERIEKVKFVEDKLKQRHDWVQKNLDALEQSNDEQTAQRHVKNCWDVWLNHPDEDISKIFTRGIEGKKDAVKGIERFNRVLACDPHYAEAWNQRAICHYHLQNWECVLWDVDRTLALEPRHFGALWGGIHACEQMKENYCEDKHLNYLERYTSLCKFDIDAQERLQTLQEKRSPIDVETIERSNPDR